MEEVQITSPFTSTLGRQLNNTNPINETTSAPVLINVNASLHNPSNSDKSKQKQITDDMEIEQ